MDEILEDNPSKTASSRLPTTTVLGENCPCPLTRDETPSRPRLALRETERPTSCSKRLRRIIFRDSNRDARSKRRECQRSRVVIFLSDGLPDDGGTTGRQRQPIPKPYAACATSGTFSVCVKSCCTPRTWRATSRMARRGITHQDVRCRGQHFRSFASDEGLDFCNWPRRV